MDIRMFEAKNETRRKTAALPKRTTNLDKSQPNMLGKSKRFNLERFTAVLDYLLSIYAEKATENNLYGHTTEFYATLNSLADDGLLKKTFNKKAGPDAGSTVTNDDITSVFFKCNFDVNFITGVAKKIDFSLEDFMDLFKES